MTTASRARAARNEDGTSWYHQRWPWILIGIPATSVVLGMTLLYFAITTADGLVVDDYYRAGRAIDHTMARSLLAGDLGMVADVSVRSDRLSVRLAAKEGVDLPAGLIVSVVHPTRSGEDQVLRLNGVEGVYSGPLAPLSLGRWQIHIEDESRSWRMNGTVNLPAETEKRIVPYDS